MNKIRQIRKEKGLSITELAEMIGISYQSLQRYEAGKRDPSIQVLIALANFFDVSVDYLVGREPKSKVIKTYQYYVIDDDYTLRSLGDSSPISEHSVPILDESELETLEYSLELSARLSQILSRLYDCFYQDKISDGSYEELTRILINKESFYVEVIERVDS